MKKGNYAVVALFAAILIILSLRFVAYIQNNRISKKPSAQWITFKSAKAKFQAQFPLQPTEKDTDIILGQNNEHATWSAYLAKVGDDIYRVDYIPLPEDLQIVDANKSVLDMAKLIITYVAPLASTNPLNPKNTVYGNYPALEYSFKLPDQGGIGYMRTILAGRSVYTIGIETKNKNEANLAKFAGSLQIVR